MTVKLRPPRRRRPHLLVEGVRYVVPLTWFHTMIALRHIELRGKRQDEARLCFGRELRINAEGTVQIIDTATEIGFPVPISPIYKMGDRRDFGENHIDLSLAQPTREFVVEKTGLVNDARVQGVRFERKFAEVPA